SQSNSCLEKDEKRRLSVAIIDELQTFDLMEIHVKKFFVFYLSRKVVPLCLGFKRKDVRVWPETFFQRIEISPVCDWRVRQNASVMDLNVCSRRVHDGYATIRSRGRSRPRAVYRSDSEEFLKEAGGPYALPQLSNFPVVVASNNDLQQVPRWSDLGRDCLLIENYGTLRGSKKGNPSPEERRLVTLNTFASSKVGQGHVHGEARVNGQGQPSDAFSSKNGSDERKLGLSIDRVYDDGVCAEERISFRSKSDPPSRFAEDHFRPTAMLDSDLNRLNEMESYADCSARRGGGRRSFDVRRDDARLRRIIGDTKGRQPIYAVPNVLSRPRRDRRVAIVDGNYVPSGDLYRTTAKYIEDINKNIAEIDKSYEELKSSSNSRNNPSSTYGVINRIAKGESIDRPGIDLCGYARKRDMAPMPPISSDFGESLLEEKTDGVKTDSSILILKSSSGRPNSFGKLPPKLLPRSSSIENTSRHSTGSTTTTSSTKSTESLYAISEVGGQSGENDELGKSGSGIVQDRSLDFKQDRRASTEGSDELESKDEMSSTDDDRPTIVRSVDRLPVTSSIRKNRSRVDSADRSSYLKRDRVSTCQTSRCDSVRRSNDLVANDRNFYKSPTSLAKSVLNYSERRCDTLPTRRSRATSRPLHKSSEDVLDGERPARARSSSLHRPCTSDLDLVGERRNDERLDNRKNNFDNFFRPPPLYLMDATDVILRGHLDRTSRGLQQWQDHLSAARSSTRRTRHNSLESEEPENKDNDDNRHRHGGFATLPRRGNLAKDQPSSDDPLRRLSGNAPILEPLYEHAVSDPVKPRSAENVIPWWELATRKYRHRSCPSLQ
ncbi:unnamed protein product, partial [Heterotrigona itama]